MDNVGRASPLAHLGGRLGRDLVEISDDPSVLDTAGRWAVVATFEGDVTCARFATWEERPLPHVGSWKGPEAASWTTSMNSATYQAAVREVRDRVAAGTVYQVNVCRVMSAPLSDGDDLQALAVRVGARHHAPYGGFLRLPGVEIVTASPELFLRRRDRRVWSAPIKGTGRTAADLTDKDTAENIMIVDLVRHDLAAVCEPGTVEVSSLLARERHPGLVHLVSTVTGRLTDGVGWRELFAAALPPGSVSGAPKSSALTAIDDLETVPRGPYCGAIGWVDADRGTAELAVGIRTFWAVDGILRFGTGAGITWGSDPSKEWAETMLKAERLVGLATC